MNCRVWAKLEEIHGNLATLPLHWESRVLGPQRAGGMQRVKTGTQAVGWLLNMYKWSSFDEIRRNPSKSGNISTSPESWVLSVQVGDKGSKRRGVGRFWWWLNLYNWPSFEEIRRNPSNSGNQVATSGGI